MASVAGTSFRRLIQSIPLFKNRNPYQISHFPFRNSSARWFSAEAARNEFDGVNNAYDMLGVPETSSFDEIKASFRKLAKETHPDLAGVKHGPAASQRFVEILAAYEILSDLEKRAHYDRYLLSQRKFVRDYAREGSRLFLYESDVRALKPMEVVEWLRWYRSAVKDILAMEKNMPVGTGHFDVLEHDFYSAVHAAYYGPLIEDWDLLPDCFEAEERSSDLTHEVLHLVSGRDLFGKICVADKLSRLQQSYKERLNASISTGLAVNHYIEKENICRDLEEEVNSQDQLDACDGPYVDLELHLSGRVVAVATRGPPKCISNDPSNDDSLDHIHVFLMDGESVNSGSEHSPRNGEPLSRIPVGTITGLGTIPEEGSCDVYNHNGDKTHVIMKHRTFLVRHVHWYQHGDEVSVCECRCSRAKLPPSRFWLFEPRCYMHDIGGWYVETYGRDQKGRTVPSRRNWDVFDSSEGEKRLHPAVYLLATAYRTLDIEESKRRKRKWMSFIEHKVTEILNWGKQLAKV